MQQSAFLCAELLKNDLVNESKGSVRATISKGLTQLIQAWERLEDRKRILRGKPLPGSLRPVSKPSKAKRGFSTREQPIESPSIDPSKESLSIIPDPQKPTGGGE